MIVLKTNEDIDNALRNIKENNTRPNEYTIEGEIAGYTLIQWIVRNIISQNLCPFEIKDHVKDFMFEMTSHETKDGKNQVIRFIEGNADILKEFNKTVDSLITMVCQNDEFNDYVKNYKMPMVKCV
jgi:hypothetical protein